MSTIERFMAVDPEDGVALDICRVPAGLRFTAHGYEVVSAWIDPKDAPAIALSVLEAAGWPEDAVHSVTHQILDNLRRVVEISEQLDKETKLTERREALAKKAGHSIYMYAPQNIKTLIAQVVELEDKLAAK